MKCIWLLLWLCIERTGSEVRKALVATPVTYGHIHLFLNTEELWEDFQVIEKNLEKMRHRLEISGGHDRFLKQVERAHEVKIKVLEKKMKSIMRVTHPHGEPDSKNTIKRSKRELVLIAIGVVAVIGLIAFGLSVANRVELEKLQRTVEAQDEDLRSVITTLEAQSTKVEDNFKVINATLQNFERRFDHVLTWSLMRENYRDLNEKMDSWLEGIFEAYKGNLHPALVSWPDLEKALHRIEIYAKTQGFKVVPFDNYMEAIFSQPLSVVANKTGLHVIVSVPLIPEGTDIMDLYFFGQEHVEFRKGMKLVVDLHDEIVIAERGLRFTKSVSASALHSCRQFKGLWLCQEKDFVTKPHSCGSAYLFQDAKKMRHFCQTSMVRQKVHFQAVENGTLVRTLGETVVRRECPGSEQDRTYRVVGEGLVEYERGCHLEADDYLYFDNKLGPLEQEVSEVDLSWHLEDLDGDYELDELIEAGHGLAALNNLSSVRLSFEEVRGHLEDRRRSLHRGVTWGLSSGGIGIGLLIVFCVLGRIVQVYMRMRRDEPLA